VITYAPAQFTSLGIADGRAGIRQTLRLMRKLVTAYRATPSVRETAISIVASTPPKAHLAEIDAVFEYVRDSIRYVMDVFDTETLHSPDQVLRIGAGDCDDKSILLASLLESIGYATEFAVVGYTNRNNFEHVYTIAILPDGTEISLDPTEQVNIGWAPPNPVAYETERTI